jgi:hypothetical protein
MRRRLKRSIKPPGLRIKTGADALWKLYLAPNHRLPRLTLEQDFGALDLHFGWFCRRVAEELGANHPDVLALVDYSEDTAGAQILTLKPSVDSAMAGAQKAAKKSS